MTNITPTSTAEVFDPELTVAHEESDPTGGTVSNLVAALQRRAEERTKKAPASPSKGTRNTNPGGDNIWPRHHAICLAGAIGDLVMGGPEAARQVPEPLKQCDGISNDIPAIVLELSPWLLKSGYLNLEESPDVMANGIGPAFKRWMANRVYYFYYKGGKTEHPANRIKGNLGAVYQDFFAKFSASIHDLAPISEETARDFWLSVADRVAFQIPRRTNGTATSVVVGDGAATNALDNMGVTENE